MGQNLQCGKDITNISFNQCVAYIGSIIKGWLSAEEKKTITHANALLEATWLAIENEAVTTRNFILEEADEVTVAQSDMVFKDSNVKKQIFVKKGDIAIKLEYWDLKDCEAAALRSFHGQRLYFYPVTKLSAILGGTDGTNFLNVPVDVYVSDPIPNETEEDSWRTDVFINFRNVEGNFTKAIFTNDANYNSGSLWDAQDRHGILDVVMTEVSVTTTAVIVDIVASCDERLINEPLVTADFLATDQSDSATPTLTVTNVAGSNRYEIEGLTTGKTYDITLINQPAMTTKGYEAQGTLVSTTD